MVAGDHLHHDARGVAGAHRVHGARARRVDHADQAEEDQVPGDCPFVEGHAGRHRTARQGQHAQAASRHLPARRFQ
jgi:hypothetical protein